MGEIIQDSTKYKYLTPYVKEISLKFNHKRFNMAQKCPSCDYPYVPNGSEVYCPNCGQKIVQPGCSSYIGAIFVGIIVLALVGQCNKGGSNDSNTTTNTTTADSVAAPSQVQEPRYDEPRNFDPPITEQNNTNNIETPVAVDTTTSN
jgi:uncharacterized Zn finger protein (UPF0148 family)